jgi:hypothetical protein
MEAYGKGAEGSQQLLAGRRQAADPPPPSTPRAHACSKAQAQFQGLRAGNSTFTAFIDNFTSNTYIMVVTSDPALREWCSDEAEAGGGGGGRIPAPLAGMRRNWLPRFLRFPPLPTTHHTISPSLPLRLLRLQPTMPRC